MKSKDMNESEESENDSGSDDDDGELDTELITKSKQGKQSELDYSPVSTRRVSEPSTPLSGPKQIEMTLEQQKVFTPTRKR
jgi:hypothetical protein